MPTRPKLRPTSQGRLVRQLRKARGWNYQQMREAMRRRGLHVVSEGTIRNLETGETEAPHFPAQHSIATVLDQDPNVVWPEA